MSAINWLLTRAPGLAPSPTTGASPLTEEVTKQTRDFTTEVTLMNSMVLPLLTEKVKPRARTAKMRKRTIRLLNREKKRVIEQGEHFLDKKTAPAMDQAVKNPFFWASFCTRGFQALVPCRERYTPLSRILRKSTLVTMKTLTLVTTNFQWFFGMWCPCHEFF